MKKTVYAVEWLIPGQEWKRFSGLPYFMTRRVANASITKLRKDTNPALGWRSMAVIVDTDDCIPDASAMRFMAKR